MIMIVQNFVQMFAVFICSMFNAKSCHVFSFLFNRNNFVKLNFFYESLNYETIEEEPLIDVSNSISRFKSRAKLYKIVAKSVRRFMINSHGLTGATLVENACFEE